MIVAGPGVASSGSIDRSYVTVMDLAPTFLRMAEAAYPDDGSVRPMLGESMTALLNGTADSVHDSEYVTVLYHSGKALVRKGAWKLSNLEPPFSPDAFELFNVEVDPGETTNLATSEPARFAELLALWKSERLRLGIVLPSDVENQ
jgi:arylsulfatase|tara:strand:- start:912 stop:1349 length:438 start_codon:yes stop_codon:yes gene_type:complete